MEKEPLKNEQPAEAESGEKLSLLDRAVIFAVKAHSGSFRKGTKMPYIVHPMEAASIAASLCRDLPPEEREKVIVAAVLHDVLEDTGTTEEVVAFEFGEDVLKLVKSDSENKRPELPAAETWQIRKQETIDFVKYKATVEEKIVIFADKLSNMRSLYADFLVIGDELWNRFNVKEKSKHAWYYGSFVENMKEFEGTPAYEEFVLKFRAVFCGNK